MATVSIHLKRPQTGVAATQQEPTAIFLLLYANNRQYKVYTGHTIKPAYWLKDEHKAKTKGLGENVALNDSLALMAERLLACYMETVAKGLLPTPAQLKAAIAPADVEAAEKQRLTLDAAFALWIKQTREDGRQSTAKGYETTRKHLIEFGTVHRAAVEFEALTMSFFDKYTAYLSQQRKPKLTDNSVAKDVIILKTFMKWAALRGHNTRQEIPKAKYTQRDPAIIALTENELRDVAALDLNAQPKLANARDLFLLMCYTGLRFSDLHALATRPDCDKGEYLDITALKTDLPAIPPVILQARPLLNRLFAGEIHVISNQRLNDYIKQIGEAAGIDSPTEKLLYRGGERLVSILPKYELISCHTGRKTFVTLAMRRGGNFALVMKATGHTNINSFRRYMDDSKPNVVEEFKRLYSSEDEAPLPVMRVA